jgi:cytochrome c-type biogenesis protein CcmF
MFFAFIGITSVASLSLLIKHWDELKGENHLRSMLSRESLFLFNNLLFMGVLVVCFWGVIFPLISELLTGQKITVGPPFYERATAPLIAGLLLLMAIAPLSAYGRTTLKTLGRHIWIPLTASLFVPVIMFMSGISIWPALLGYWLAALVSLVTLFEIWRGVMARRKRHAENPAVALWRLVRRNRRRYGSHLIHLGVVFLAIGILGIELFQSETQGTVAKGEQLTLGRYVMIFEDLEQYIDPDGSSVTQATLAVYRDGELIDEIYPRQHYYYEMQQTMTIPGVRSTVQDDLYVILAGWEAIGTDGATFKVYHNPLVNFVWWGAYVFILGTIVAIWPKRVEAAEKKPKSTPPQTARG